VTVLIAGAGIAGLTLGLTLHQIGVPFRLYEAVERLTPLGVGINLQPNAVRELFDLGLAAELARIGVATRSLGFYTKTGREIWTEPRGRDAGYNWPQYSVHRGRLQMMLHDALIEREGADCILTGHGAVGFECRDTACRLRLERNGRACTAEGTLLVAADGIHSAIRHQMVPEEGAPLWGGAILWRGVTRMAPFLSGADMILAGHDTQRIVAYPISPPDPGTGDADVNWIAERRVDPATGWRKEDWNREARVSEFLLEFEDWRFDWLDVPQMIRGAERVFEYPMVDRDPLERWTQGCVTLMGDAAHPTYPVGSNGASQAIVDARVLGAALIAHGVTEDALKAYERQMRPRTSRVTLANRGSGPDAILQRVEDLCGGTFDRIEDVLPRTELAAHANRYKSLAGFAIDTLNNAPPIISAEQSEGGRPE
jgi:2-polyprenyl-6-methoxyphenol hydroxylase-like FAD-dependent oxidoreductase